MNIFQLFCVILFLSIAVNGFQENKHHNNAEVEEILRKVHKKCHAITRLKTLTDFKNRHLTNNNNTLTVIEFGSPPGRHIPGRPEFKYIGNMHGNEVVSREILLGLVVHLCDKWIQRDQKIRSLISRTRIHILVTMNPDGWATATRASYHDRNVITGRRNARNIDLNRNFPDLDRRVFFHTDSGKGSLDHVLTKLDLMKPMARETQMVIKWMLPIPFVLSANLHGGELVANYPYDATMYPGYTVYSRSPDDAEFRRLAHAYANNHLSMSTAHCGRRHFKGGITNGAHWYSVTGGMQDFNYLATNCFELTLEVSCRKYPRAATLPQYHKQNLPALLALIWEIHTGVKGKVSVISAGSASGRIPAVGARITIRNITDGIGCWNKHAVITGKAGDYYRLLPDGVYEVTAAMPGMSLTKCVSVKNSPQTKDATVLNFALRPGVKGRVECNIKSSKIPTLLKKAMTRYDSLISKKKVGAFTDENDDEEDDMLD